ncbi:hypothetical protein [Kitasatospora sp. MBT63]|uniref:hypothetical protein n=1 Tax=Kitasatospora sp. MBT63 TaxID=1444768 RepID=UPI00053B9387|nr:hypothetical protein [Kitasatospora sp. MBT63]
MAEPETQARRCHCLVAHPTTDAERAEIVNAITEARRINDSGGLLINLARLTGAGTCPANAGRP